MWGTREPAPSTDDLTYLNINFTGEDSDTIAKVVRAETTISKSGTIVDRADGYVSVMRLAFTSNNPIIIAPCTSAQFTADGVTTDWSITVRIHKAGDPLTTFYYGRGYIQLPIDPSDVILGQTEQPKDLYASFWSPEQWVDSLTNAVSAAYTAANAAAGVPLTGDDPFVSIIPGGGGRLRFTFSGFDYWDQRQPRLIGDDFADLFVNWKMQEVVDGWGFDLRTFDNQPLDPNGADYKLVARSDGYNYSSPFDADGGSLNPPLVAPVHPTTLNEYRLLVDQTFPSQKLPGIVRISVLTSLPTVQEFIPGDNGKGTLSVLTDFAPDTSLAMLGETQTITTYDANVGNARWIKLKGNAPISTFTVRVITEDWLGQSRDLFLYGGFDRFDMKLAFAPKPIVDNYLAV